MLGEDRARKIVPKRSSVSEVALTEKLNISVSCKNLIRDTCHPFFIFLYILFFSSSFSTTFGLSSEYFVQFVKHIFISEYFKNFTKFLHL